MEYPPTTTTVRRRSMHVALICVFVAGCSPFQSAHRLLYRDYVRYPQVTDHDQSLKTYRAWAISEWTQHAPPRDTPHGESYKRGFIAGFTDAVYAGGDGEPPIVPPKPYWRVLFRNPSGDGEIAAWTDGFRAGARIAFDNGYRHRALVPTTRANVLPPSVDSPSLMPQSDKLPQWSPNSGPAFLLRPRDEALPEPEVLPLPQTFEWGNLSLEGAASSIAK